MIDAVLQAKHHDVGMKYNELTYSQLAVSHSADGQGVEATYLVWSAVILRPRRPPKLLDTSINNMMGRKCQPKQRKAFTHVIEILLWILCINTFPRDIYSSCLALVCLTVPCQVVLR